MNAATAFLGNIYVQLSVFRLVWMKGSTNKEWRKPMDLMRRTRSFPCLIGVIAGLWLAGLLTACLPAAEEEEPAAAVTPTADPGAQESALEVAPTEPATPTQAPTTEPTATPAATQPLPTPTAEAAAAVAGTLYQVAYVAEDDVLNLRSGPGVSNEIVATLSPHATDVQITGQGQSVAGSTWVPIATGQDTGWVNRAFLTPMLNSETFCQDEAVLALLGDLQTAVAEENGQLLADLVHPQRGLRLRHDWWNPEVHLSASEVRDIFTDNTSYEWGVEDGSGFDITGSFSEEILPLLERDLLAATETACNEIQHGSTTGLVILPYEYQPVNFYSLYRPAAADQIEFDWGTWVVGIERWQGEYTLSFLVHFDYEI
jgi:uncharacterized protein YraI